MKLTHKKTDLEVLPYRKIRPMILKWGLDRRINNHKSQIIKFYEELGELAKGILKEDYNLIYDSIGDIAVVLILLGRLNNLEYDYSLKYNLDVDELHLELQTLEPHELLMQLSSVPLGDYHTSFRILEVIALKYKVTLIYCINLAYNEIKNRQGITIKGNFIKLV